MHNCLFGVLSNSGTSSLQVALQALKELHGWRDGDEVIVPASTFVATANIVLHNRMVPRLVDVEPDTYNINPKLIEDAIVLGKTRAIIPVHLYGQPADMTAIKQLATMYNLKIIEDSCECVLATHAGRPVGSWGDIACFSTYVAHILTTGVGGIATTNNPDYAVKMRSLVNHGRDGIYISIDDDDEARGERLKKIIERRFRFDSVGHSFRITELEAAIGVAQLPDLRANIETRLWNAFGLNNLLRDLSPHLQLPTVAEKRTHSFMMYPIVVKTEGKWDLCHFLEEHNIETREMLRLSDQPAYKGLWKPTDYPIAAWLNECGFYIGCHQDLTAFDLDYISDVFHAYEWKDD